MRWDHVYKEEAGVCGLLKLGDVVMKKSIVRMLIPFVRERLQVRRNFDTGHQIRTHEDCLAMMDDDDCSVRFRLRSRSLTILKTDTKRNCLFSLGLSLPEVPSMSSSSSLQQESDSQTRMIDWCGRKLRRKKVVRNVKESAIPRSTSTIPILLSRKPNLNNHDGDIYHIIETIWRVVHFGCALYWHVRCTILLNTVSEQ